MSDTIQLFRALADETRLRILNLLVRGELCVCQIVEVLGMGQSKVSRHLAHLRNARLVNARRQGLWIHYSLAEPKGRLHEQVVQWLNQAEDEVPMAATDLRALANSSACADVCQEVSQEDSPGEKRGRRQSVAAVGP